MKPKVFIDTFPYGYKRERNLNGSVALSLNTEGTKGFVFIKKVPLSKRMPKIAQMDIDALQCDFGFEHTIIDWYDDGSCRYMMIMETASKTTSYRMVLNAFFGDETFELRGNFFEKGNMGVRESVYNERYLKKLPSDALTTKTDFADERYDILFPDHPLSHCRRLANVIALNANCMATPGNQITNSSDISPKAPET